MRNTRNLFFLALSVTALVVILNVRGMGQTVSCSSDNGIGRSARRTLAVELGW